MQEKSSFFERLNQKLKESLTVKLFTIGVLILLLLIPLEMVESLIRERNYRSQNTISDVSAEWSKAQEISGPIITIPYHSYEKTTVNEVDKIIMVTRYLHLMPEELSYTGELFPKTLHRGIYDAVVYEGKLTSNGSFNLAQINELNIEPENILWQEAVVNMGISDMRGIANQIEFNVGNKNVVFLPGLKNAALNKSGVHATMPLSGEEGLFTFRFNIDLKGSFNIKFLPLAKTTDVKIKSAWPSPSFIGSFLPKERNISTDGFTAHWHVLNLNRPIPQIVRNDKLNFSEYNFGVELFMPTTQYQKSERTAKYGALVIALIFLIIFFVQIMQKLSIHPFQYILIGLALVIFYTLLVSISEFTSFNIAYLIAGAAVVVLVTIYLHGVIKNLKSSGIIFGLQTFIYGFIYVIIQLEDTALLIGSIGLFLTLAVIMLVSRKVDWYHLKSKSQQKVDKLDANL